MGEVGLVSDFKMRDGVSLCIRGTFPERNLLVQLNEKEMENAFGWSMANKNRDGIKTSQCCCVKIGILQMGNLCPYCNLALLLLTLDHHFTSETCDSCGHNDRIKQLYNSQVSAVLVLVLRGVHLEMSWWASQFLVQLLHNKCIWFMPDTFSFEDDDSLCCCVFCYSLAPTTFHRKEEMEEGGEQWFPPQTSSGHFSYRELSL